MNREIKFRAWDDESKVFIDWDNFMNNQSGNWMMTAFKNDIYKFQQFTGLKDKHGKEIFEGDILKISDRCDEQEVIFEDGFYCTNEFAMFELCRDKNRTFEVIGNIYENPELLEGTA